jgi:hypothetical protein
MSEQRVQRRLAAILAADVVGYSRLMGEDEAGALDDSSWLQPQMHIWCSHNQPWVNIESGGQKFEKNPPAG